jgi:hypothetical protein
MLALATRGRPNKVLIDEAFSWTSKPEEQTSISFTMNFLLSFSGFANNTSCSDVLLPVRDEAFLHLFTPLVIFSGDGVISTPEA